MMLNVLVQTANKIGLYNWGKSSMNDEVKEIIKEAFVLLFG
jgi:hypothetical protein